jgi:hypothetical protein
MNTNMEVKVRFLNTAEGTVEVKNLINNGGLNMLASTYVADVFKHCQMGTGTRQNAKSSDGNLLTQAGTSVTCPVPFFSTEDGINQRLIIFADGTHANIVSRVSEFEVTVAESQAVAAQIATVFSIEETQLDTPVDITDSCVASANGSTVDFTSDILTIEDTRTFTFGTSSGTTDRSEFGWGPTGTLNDPVFGRVVKAVQWLNGAAMEVEVTVTRIIDCSIVTIASLPVTGLAVASTSRLMFGNATLQGTAYRSQINATTGASEIGASADVSLLEPNMVVGIDHDISVSDTSSTLDFGNTADAATGDSGQWLLSTYSNGNYYHEMSYSFVSSAYSSVVWRTIAFWIAASVAQLRILFDANQTFDGDLNSLTFRTTWGRV